MTKLDYNVISDARLPIKAWTRGVQLEDAARKQLLNIANMPFIHKHVAVMPDVHYGMGATVGSVIATKGAIIPAAVGVDIGCFRGDTKIPLMDGTQATLESLAGREEPFWVYSIDKSLRVAPGLARCVKTRVDAPLMRVVVSGGDEIICTPDHEFMLQDGTYRQASQLQFNDSLMPLYRSWQTRDGYEAVSNGKGSAKMTHIMAWEVINGPVPAGHVVHHMNHIHFDNQPTNLQLMTASAHSAHHRAVGHQFDNSDPVFQRLRMAGIGRRKGDPVKAVKMAAVGSANISKYMAERPEHFAAAVAGNGKRGAPVLEKFNTTPRACTECSEVPANPAALRWHKARAHGHNHKVMLTQHLDERADVYCLQVDEHHNFALAAGVFVHNCGMMAVRTSLVASDLPDTLLPLRTAIEAAIPHGRTNNGGVGDRGAWGDVPDGNYHRLKPAMAELASLCERYPDLERAAARAPQHAGTLGTGNHFVEVCLDEDQAVWVMLHSGSRGIGNRIGSYFIDKAKEDMRRWFINLPDQDLAYMPQGSSLFKDYCDGVSWAQGYARLNREIMMDAAMGALIKFIGRPVAATCTAVNCHHNYVAWERHFGENVIVTRKGAVSAQLGELGIIPGSMGAKSFIVRGKGNRESFCSCSHGAGRSMSRTEARRRFTLEDHAAATAGVECRKDEEVIDETPGAYKAIEDVMRAQESLVEIVHTLRQVVCVKG